MDYCYILFAPKIGTKLIRLTPPVRPVSLDGLTGGPDRSDRWALSPSRIEES
jgi:hypothetical protein